jgi:hypothetical protein
MSSIQAGGEKVVVKKTGGVGEVKRADVTTLKANVEKDIEKEKLVENAALQQAERMREEVSLHKKLEAEAEEMANQKLIQSDKEHEQAEELRQAVESLKITEKDLGACVYVCVPQFLLLTKIDCD